MAVEAISDLALVFILVGIFILIFNHFSLPTIPSYILAGVIAGLFINQENIFEMARWGLTFMIFAFGASINFRDIKKVLWESEILLGLQVLVLGILGFIVGIILGLGYANTLYFTVAVVLSSTIIGFKLASPKGKTRLVHGRLSEAIQFTDDLVAVFLILILGTITVEGFTAFSIFRNLFFGLILLFISFFIYKYGFKYIIRFADGSGELILMGSISLLFVFLGLSQYLGLPILIGAFTAGLAVRIESHGLTEVITGIESIKYFFSAIFFAMLGGLLNITSIYTVVIAIILILLVAFVKPMITTLILTWKGYDTRTSTLTGLRFSQMSEFTLIIAMEGLLIGILVLELFDAIIIASVVTMTYSSIVLRKEEEVYHLFKDFFKQSSIKKIEDHSSVRSDIENHVIILGYGRQGTILAKRCLSRGIDHLVIENDPIKLDSLKEGKSDHVFGDAMNEYTWKKAKVKKAKLILSTVDNHLVSKRLLEMDLNSPIIPKTDSPERTQEYIEMGAAYVNNPNMLVFRHMKEKVLSKVDEG